MKPFFVPLATIMFVMLDAGCIPAKKARSRVRNGSQLQASVSLEPAGTPPSELMFMHNQPSARPENFSLGQLKISAIEKSGTINPGSLSNNSFDLPPLMFQVKMTATDGSKSLSCDGEMSIGSGQIPCQSEAGEFVGPQKPKTCYCSYTMYSNPQGDGPGAGSKEESFGFISLNDCNAHIDYKVHQLDLDTFYRFDACSMR